MYVKNPQNKMFVTHTIGQDRTIPNINKNNKIIWGWELVAHAYNPSYSGGRDQEDCYSKPSWASSLWDAIL
jgi:hypothetical protein